MSLLDSITGRARACPHDNEVATCPRCAMEDIVEESTILDPLQERDIAVTVSNLPGDVEKVMRYMGRDIVLAGGFIRESVLGQNSRDIDLIVHDAQSAKQARMEMSSNGGFVEGDKSVTRKPTPQGHPVQILWRWGLPRPEHPALVFDFTINRAAIWFDRTRKHWFGVADARFYSDLFGRRLVVGVGADTERSHAAGFLHRMLYFTQKGYWIDNENLAKVITMATTKMPSLQTVDPGTLQDEIQHALDNLHFVPKLNVKPYDPPSYSGS